MHEFYHGLYINLRGFITIVTNVRKYTGNIGIAPRFQIVGTIGTLPYSLPFTSILPCNHEVPHESNLVNQSPHSDPARGENQQTPVIWLVTSHAGTGSVIKLLPFFTTAEGPASAPSFLTISFRADSFPRMS